MQHVRHEPTNSRYVLVKNDAQIGVAEYRVDDGTITFTHTEIDEAVREHGMASNLVQNALDDVRKHTKHKVVAECPYVASWLEKHPDYQDLTRR